MILRPYQQTIVDQIRAEMKTSRAVLAQLSTGAGKTALASYMVKAAVEKGNRVFFCVHRRDLLRQTANTFKNFDINYSYIASGMVTNPGCLAMICSIDTLRSRLEHSPLPKLVFIDECHMAASNSWSKIISYYKEHGSWIIGLSATPERTDGKGLGVHFERMVGGPPMRWLIDNKFLSDYRMFAPSSPDVSGIDTRLGDFAKDQLAERIQGNSVLIGDAIKHYKKYADGKLAIVYCVSRKHSQNTVEQFRQAGISAAHIDGETPMEERAKIISAYARRDILVLCNVALISTGFDLAAQVGMDVTVECIVDLSPTKSLSLYLQKIGRGLRYKPYPAILLDHAGNCARHGLPCEDRNWTLADRDRSSRETGERTLTLRQCEQEGCFRAHKPAPQCPNCGYVYPIQYREIEEVDGELAEIEKQQQKKQARMEVGMARTLADLKRIADERGYAKGWIWKQAQVKGIKF